MTQTNNLAKSINVTILLDSRPLGGQLNAVLERKSQVIDITNKIQGNWSENIAGIKSWSISCSGLYVLDDESFKILENSFMNSQYIEVQVSMGNYIYQGDALIVDFPLTAIYNKEFKYSLKLLGSGPLTPIST